QGIHENGRILRPDADGVTGEIAETRLLERELYVAHVLRRLTARDLLIDQHFGGKRSRSSMPGGFSRPMGRVQARNGELRLFRRFRLDLRDDAFTPGVGNILEIDVAIGPIMYSA